MTISGSARLAGVAGWPIGHSLSPALHAYWIAAHQLDAAYLPLAIKPEDFADAFRVLGKIGFRGFNVTLPHKEAAFALSDAHDEAARLTGAVNTVVFENGRALGRNTDVHGFAELLRRSGVALPGNCAVVLGAGGASRAAIAAMLQLGVTKVLLANRSSGRAQELAARFGAAVKTVDWGDLPAALPRAGLLVNTTSLGMQGQPALEVDLAPLPPHAAVVDIVYRPLETALLARAKARGLKAIDGLGMLMHQAQPAFAAWFGVSPEATPELRAHLTTLLER